MSGKMAVDRLHDELHAVGLSQPGTERLGALAHLSPPAHLERLAEPGAVELGDGNGLRPRARIRDPLPPEELITEERHHGRGPPGAQAGGGGAGAYVMADGAAPREQPVVWAVTDQKDVRRERPVAEMRPAFRHDAARAGLLERREDGAGDGGRVFDVDRAEPDIDRRFAGGEEVEQRGRRLVSVRLVVE